MNSWMSKWGRKKNYDWCLINDFFYGFMQFTGICMNVITSSHISTYKIHFQTNSSINISSTLDYAGNSTTNLPSVAIWQHIIFQWILCVLKLFRFGKMMCCQMATLDKPGLGAQKSPYLMWNDDSCGNFIKIHGISIQLTVKLVIHNIVRFINPFGKVRITASSWCWC